MDFVEVGNATIEKIFLSENAKKKSPILYPSKASRRTAMQIREREFYRLGRSKGKGRRQQQGVMNKLLTNSQSLFLVILHHITTRYTIGIDFEYYGWKRKKPDETNALLRT